MTKEQERLLELLCEIDMLCTELNLSYSLVDRTLLYSAQAVGFRGCEADITMLYHDFLVFRYVP